MQKEQTTTDALIFEIPLSYNHALARYRRLCEKLHDESNPALVEQLFEELRLIRDYIDLKNEEIAETVEL